MNRPIPILNHFLDVTVMRNPPGSIIPLVHAFDDCLVLFEQLIVE